MEERSLFLEIVSLYRVLPITTDSHFGEYIGWAWDVADHDGTKEFYSRYRKYMLFNKGLPDERLQRGTEEEEFWRVVHIIAGIVADSGHEELAVNIPNDDFIEALPRNQIVEVPAVIDRNGTKGIRLDSYPEGIVRSAPERGAPPWPAYRSNPHKIERGGFADTAVGPGGGQGSAGRRPAKQGARFTDAVS